jgi:hypothetical protein
VAGGGEAVEEEEAAWGDEGVGGIARAGAHEGVGVVVVGEVGFADSAGGWRPWPQPFRR